MTSTSWGIGCLLACVEVGALVVAARTLRRRFLPAWDGAAAVLAASVIGLGLLVGVGMILGSVGFFRREFVLVWLVAIAVATHVFLKPTEPAPVFAVRTAKTGAGSVGSLVAAAVVGLGLTFVWVARIVAVYQRGSSDGDSLMYHLPFAARFVQTGWVTRVPHVGPDAWVAFYPANGELVTASAMLPFHHDALVPLLSLGWLALALLAGWCIGRVFDRAPLGLVGVGLVLSLAVMPSTQAGTGRVDLAVVAMVLAGVAVILQEPRTLASCAVGGAALGLALGTKFVVLTLVGTLILTVGAVLWRRHDLRHAAVWAGVAVVAGSPWYIRNWIVAGNPIPVLGAKLGPLGVDALPQERLRVMEDSSVIDYLGDPGFFPHAFTPAMTALAGPVPWVVAWAAVGAAVAVLVLVRRPLDLAHAVMASALAACLAYVVSPNTGVYGQGIDSAFDDNLIALNARYLVPGLIVLFSLLPVAATRVPGWVGDTVALLAAGYTSYRLVRSFDWPFGQEWPVTGADKSWAAGLVAAAVLVVVAARLIGTTFKPWMLAPPAALALLVGGWSVIRSQDLHRYADSPPEYAALWHAVNGLEDQRIALVGDWVHYPYVGDDLDNEIEYLGLPLSDGIYQPPRDCAELRQALTRRRYDLVAVQKQQFAVGVPQEIDWVLSLPGTRKLIENQGGALVELPREIEPDAGCGAVTQ